MQMALNGSHPRGRTYYALPVLFLFVSLIVIKLRKASSADLAGLSGGLTRNNYIRTICDDTDLERMVEAATVSSTLSLEISLAEITMRDMLIAIRSTDLKKKETIMSSMSGCILDAKNAFRGLQKLASRFGGVVDSVTAARSVALEKTDCTRLHKQRSWLIIRWNPFQKPTDKATRELLERTLDYVLQHLERLLFEVKNADTKLHALKEQLIALQDFIRLENAYVSSARFDLEQDVWTKLGGNWRELRKYDRDLLLLKDLAACYRDALGHVTDALKTLRELRESVEEIRMRSKGLDGGQDLAD